MKMSHFDWCPTQYLKITQNVIFEFTLAFSPIFVLLKLTCLVTLFDLKLQIFKNSPERTTFGIFNEFLYFQNVNVAPSTFAVFKNETFSVIFKKLGFDKRSFI